MTSSPEIQLSCCPRLSDDIDLHSYFSVKKSDLDTTLTLDLLYSTVERLNLFITCLLFALSRLLHRRQEVKVTLNRSLSFSFTVICSSTTTSPDLFPVTQVSPHFIDRQDEGQDRGDTLLWVVSFRDCSSQLVSFYYSIDCSLMSRDILFRFSWHELLSRIWQTYSLTEIFLWWTLFLYIYFVTASSLAFCLHILSRWVRRWVKKVPFLPLDLQTSFYDRNIRCLKIEDSSREDLFWSLS
jgi:hypothetical protein